MHYSGCFFTCKRLTLDFLKLGVHFEVMRFKFIYCIEMVAAMLTGVAGVNLSVMLLPLQLGFKRCPTFFASISIILILSHRFSPFRLFKQSTDLSVLCLTNAEGECYREKS